MSVKCQDIKFDYNVKLVRQIQNLVGQCLKMVINAAKTKCVLVTGKRIPCKLDNCSLELKRFNSDIDQVHSQKLLGVTIDKHLSFDIHVEKLCVKVSQRIAVLRKIRRFIPIE